MAYKKNQRKIGYKDVEIPEDKQPVEYTCHQRRAEIFKLIIQAGHPDLISRTQLGKRYNKSHSQISQDITNIKNEIAQNIGRDAEVITRTVYEKGTKELMKQGKYREAYELVHKFNEWLFSIGAKQKVAEKHEIKGNVTYEDFAKYAQKKE